MLVDAPPLLPVTDAAVLAKICDGALLIVRHGVTSREQVVRAVESLRVVDAHLIGNVLNMAPAKGPDAYGYGYAYRYTSTPGNKITPRSNQTVPRRSAPTGIASATVVPTGGGSRRRKTPAPVTGIPSVPPPTSHVAGAALPAQSELDSFFAGQSHNGSV